MATWLENGDENTIFFHNYANNKTSINTIWEMSKENGSKAMKFNKIVELGVSHFKGIYKDPPRPNIVEILKFTTYFPMMVDEDANEMLVE